MKCIDFEKLIESVNYYREGAKSAFNPIEDDADYYNGKIDACKDIQNLITSLQREQPEVELEKEIDRFWDSCIKHKNERGGNVIWSNKIDIKVLACHFYELGLNARKED